MQRYFDLSEEVQQALDDKKPILALESTVITHGLPSPENYEVTKELEDIVRKHDVTPAIIAIMDGKIKIGLSNQELQTLVADKHSVKASTRDIPYILSKKFNAGTTVAATLFCADYAGIKVFATGGIGGVHRGDEQDVSADLIALAKTPIAVVCAGAKSILDLPKTLEFLETHSVPIVGYKTDTLPAFYSSTSPYPLSSRVDDIDTLVNLLKIHWSLGMVTSFLVANPISLNDEIASDEIEPAISSALKSAKKKKIKGKEITPYLLSELATVTAGKSLQANINLIKNNVKLGAKLAYRINVS